MRRPRPQPPAPRRRRTTRRGRAAALAVAVVALTGCMTGERPTLSSTPTAAGTMTGDPAIDAVLTLFDAVDGAVFTAQYDGSYVAIGGVVTPATVTQTSPARRSVTIGRVRFISDTGATQTCRLDAGSCTTGIDAAAVSDTGLTSEFAFGDLAKRLRRDAVARIGPTVASQVEIAGQQATCVDVPVTGGTKVYCALADGVPARFVGGDVEIALTSYRAEGDESLFATVA